MLVTSIFSLPYIVFCPNEERNHYSSNTLTLYQTIFCTWPNWEHLQTTINPFPNEKFLTLPNWKSLQTTISNLMKMAESSLKVLKTLLEKEKLLVTSNFSFSQSVFKRLVLQTHKNQGLFGKGLNIAKMMIFLFDRAENTMGKEVNTGNQHFLLFPQCFPKTSSLGSLKVGIVW